MSFPTVIAKLRSIADWFGSTLFVVLFCLFVGLPRQLPSLSLGLPDGLQLHVEPWVYPLAFLWIEILLFHLVILILPNGERVIWVLGRLLEATNHRTVGRMLMCVDDWRSRREFELAKWSDGPINWAELQGKKTTPYRLWLVGQFVPFSRNMLSSIAVYAQALGAGIIGLGEVSRSLGSASIVILGVECVGSGLLLDSFLARYSRTEVCVVHRLDGKWMLGILVKLVRVSILLTVVAIVGRLLLRGFVDFLSGQVGIEISWWAVLPAVVSTVIALLLYVDSIEGSGTLSLIVFHILGVSDSSFAASARRLRRWFNPMTRYQIIAEAQRIGFRIQRQNSPFWWWWLTDGDELCSTWIRKWNIYAIPLSLVAIGLSRFVPSPTNASVVLVSIMVSLALAMLRAVRGIIADELSLENLVPTNAVDGPPGISEDARGRVLFESALSNLRHYVDTVGWQGTGNK